MMRLFQIAAFAIVCACAAAAPPAEYRRALPGYEFSFPRDHGAHREFRTEWWYFTGNVVDEDGRPLAYELTIFRNRLQPPTSEKASPLVADEVFLGHFAVSDIAAREHESWERLARPGFGQAEAADDRMFVRMEDWRIEQVEGAILLRAEGDHAALDLILTPSKPFIIHGENGAHQKTDVAGQASHYISFTRLATTGTVRWKGRDHAVRGLSWMDHEFSSDALGEDEAGWDWFALQLDTGDDVMVYRMRRKDGTYNTSCTGALVRADGAHRPLLAHEHEIEATGSWTSKESGATYPMGWRIQIPGEDADLTVEPAFNEQEMLTTRTTGTIYWEGAVNITGTFAGEQTRGRGFVELVGYAKPFTQLSANQGRVE